MKIETNNDINDNVNNNVASDVLTKQCIDSGPNVLRSPVPYQVADGNINLSSELVKSFRKYSNKTLLIDSQTDVKWTGGQLLEATGKIVCSLVKELNLGPKKNIALICEHSDREVIFAFSCLIAGCSMYPQNPEDGLEEIKTVCTMIQVDAIATQSRYHQLVSELIKFLPSKVQIIWLEDQSELKNSKLSSIAEPRAPLSTTSMDDDIKQADNCNNNDDGEYKEDLIQRDGVKLLDHILDFGASDSDLVDMLGKEINPKEIPAYYMLTSGSTGYPKVVEMLQGAVINSALSMCRASNVAWEQDKKVDDLSGEDSERLLPMSSKSVMAGDLPLDHGAGMCFVIMTMFIGAEYVVLPYDDLDKLCKGIEDYKIDIVINGSTKVFQFLRKLRDEKIVTNVKPKYDLSSLNVIITVGAKINYVPLIREVESLYSNLRITQSYGLTECGYVTALPLSEALSNINSVGWLFPGVIATVDDSEGNHLGPNEQGELHIWTPSLFNRYLCRQGIDAKQALADSFNVKGFYKTGDLVHYDEQGRFYIHGRIKETLTLRYEWKILPAELEAIVNQHPLIDYSAIIGVPDPESAGLEIPRAFIKLIGVQSEKYSQLLNKTASDKYSEELLKFYKYQDHDSIARDIFKFAADRTAEVKHLTGGVRILEEFPRNGRLLKIDRKILKNM